MVVMARLPLIRSKYLPYHVTSRSNNQEWFYLPMEELWPLFLSALQIAQLTTDVEIHNFVLMSNHYHILLRTPLENLDQFQWEFARHFTKEVQKATNRVNHIFGGRYKWSMINDHRYFYQVYKYIYLNPVKARVVSEFAQYPYSSWRLKDDTPIDHPTLSDAMVEEFGRLETKQWIDQHYSADQTLSLKRGLRFREFKPAKVRNTRELPQINTPSP
ncbi:MAG: hypothetical protein HN730_05050 [Bdellovibrionales bacterium]|nr:hypothetical protein [Bdellovibrionales bacterium]